MTEELEQKAKQRAEEVEANQTLGIYDNDEDLARDEGWNNGYVSGFEEGYISGAIENGIQIHDMRKNPNDLPNCDESKQITFYVEEWIERIQKYHKHYCLGFYKKSFMNDDVKLFVEKSKGYENEHLPKTVLFWYENPTI